MQLVLDEYYRQFMKMDLMYLSAGIRVGFITDFQNRVLAWVTY